MRTGSVLQSKLGKQPLMNKIKLERVGPRNLSDCGIGCLSNPKNQGYQPKVEWLQER